MCDDHEQENQKWADDIAWRQRHHHPGARARNAIQHIAERNHWQADEAEDERHEIIACDMVFEQEQQARTQKRDECRGCKSEDASGPDDPAHEAEHLALHIFRYEADNRGVQSETGQIADNYHGQPDEDEDAVLEFPHPTGENNLRQESNSSARNAHGKGDEGRALRACLRSAIRKHGIQPLRHGTKPGCDPAG